MNEEDRRDQSCYHLRSAASRKSHKPLMNEFLYVMDWWMSLEAAFIFRSLPLIHRIIHQKRGTKNYWHRGNGKKEASSNKFSFPRLIVVPLSIHLLVEYISRQQISSLFLFYSFIYGCKSWKCCTIIKPLSFWLLHKCHSRTDSSQSWVWWCTKGKGKVNRCIIK